jgi:phosphatidylinositol glycan class A protein
MRHSIVMCCDFFYPRVGGVEQHIWSLSQCLLALGHRVVVVTGRYAAPGDGTRRAGVRYMAGGLRVYHLPHAPMVDQSSLPTYFALLPWLRAIFLRERATLAHGHAATSVFTHDFLFAARALGLPAVFTDHSLFGFTDFASLNVNKYLSLTLRDVQAVIAVSDVTRANVCARSGVEPALVFTIPNAIDANRFRPAAARARGGAAAAVTVVMLSRLVFRKGVDLAALVIPRACARWPFMHFLIGGDGPKRALLERMRDAHGLADRVSLIGSVPHERVRDVLVRGTIFLNCSLTESFCIAILEAACAGCHVVTTNVGGTPEVLPGHMVTLAEPTPDDVLRALGDSLEKAARTDARAQHDELAQMYAWPEVAARTAEVYDAVCAAPPPTLGERFRRLAAGGPVFGPVTVILAALVHLMALILEVLAPASDIDAAPRAPADADVYAAAHGDR